jgi:aminomethyltransferase
VYSPRLKKNIGYAMVSAKHAAPGTALTIETPGGERSAIVVAMPFIDPKKTLVKA